VRSLVAVVTVSFPQRTTTLNIFIMLIPDNGVRARVFLPNPIERFLVWRAYFHPGIFKSGCFIGPNPVIAVV
jgi:hypothetical protein